MPDTPQSDWIGNRIDTIQQDVDELRGLHPSTNEFSTLSAALKLILHSGALNMYTTVGSSNFDDIFYIDCLAGSGISAHGDSDERCFRGSPLITAEYSDEFTKMYFIERDRDNAEALRARLDYLSIEPSKYEIYLGDTNEKIREVTDDIWRSQDSERFHTFTFVDNEGLNFKWDSIEYLSDEITTDFLINYPTGGVAQEAPNRGDRVLDFFGTDLWSIDDEEFGREYLKELYENDLRSVGKDIQEWVNIYSGTRSFEYDLVYATRETSGGSEYMEAIRYLKTFIEQVDGNDVENIIDQDQETISNFHQEAEREVERDNDSQSGLEEF